MTYQGKRFLIRGYRLLGPLLAASLVAGCSSAKKIPPTQPSTGISREDTAKLLSGVAEQLDALKDALSKASPKPTESGSPQPAPAEPSPSAMPASPQPGVSSAPLDPNLHPCLQPGKDSDADSLSDLCEEQLAQTYAPVIYHSSDESYFPTSVDKFLPQTVLWFSDKDCDYKVRLQTAPTQAQLIAPKQAGTCSNRQTAFANGTRSKDKQRTFYLEDLPAEAQTGSKDPKDWLTYVHVYRNRLNGATVQYWRFYAYDNGSSEHGGDWEGLHIVLDSQFKPVRLGLLNKDEITYVAWKDLSLEGSEKNHPRIFAEADNHTSHTQGSEVKAKGCKGLSGLLSCKIDPENPATFVRQETWKSGQVSWFNGDVGSSAGLLNVGEKLTPLNGQVFIQYSGLWGSPGRSFASSGYWGPAYHDSGLGSDTYIQAWAANMLNPVHDEVYPLAISP